MRTVFRALLLAALLLGAQKSLATPQSDASYISERNLVPAKLEKLRYFLKRSFVPVYFEPISGLGIEVVDRDGFADLIPDEDVEPFIQRYLSKIVDQYVSIYTPEQLAAMAALLRADEDASVEEIFSKEYQRKQAAALEQARARAISSGSDDPFVIAIEELMVQIDAFNTLFGGKGAEELAQDVASAIAPIFILASYGHEIARQKREIDDPVIVSVVEADGILKFANPVQRQTLLRQLSTPEKNGRVRFVRPPAKSAGAD